MWTPPVVAAVDHAWGERARERHRQLTKPPGSLGRLEDIGCRLSAIQGRVPPACRQPAVLVCAGDHGVAAHGISAYPQAVTGQMVANFAHGGAAICVLARDIDASLRVVDVGVASDLPADLPIGHRRVSAGTADFTQGPAMHPEQCAAALAIGGDEAQALIANGCDCLIPGEMGIGNTTSAAALLSCLCDLPVEACVGRGTGVDDACLARKRAAVAAAVERHRHADPLQVLAGCGGLEIAALVGAILTAAAQRCVVLVDGFIVGAAALVACRLQPACRDYLVFAHHGAESGHEALLRELHAEPLLSLDLRLGEASGAALAFPLLRAACAILSDMATFTQAGVSTAGDEL